MKLPPVTSAMEETSGDPVSTTLTPWLPRVETIWLMLLVMVPWSTPCNMSTPPVCKNTVEPGAKEPPDPIKVLSWFSVSAVVAPPTAVFSVCWPVAAVSWSASVLFVLFQLAPAKMLPDSTLPAFDVVSAAVVVGAATVTAAPGALAKLSPPTPPEGLDSAFKDDNPPKSSPVSSKAVLYVPWIAILWGYLVGYSYRELPII